MSSSKTNPESQSRNLLEQNERKRRCGNHKLRKWIRGASIAGMISIAFVGCSRPYYRKTADSETNCLIDQKVATAGVSHIRRVQVDRASRMFDPFNPDRPPMPEDDPTAHRYMEMVDGKKHYPLWMSTGARILLKALIGGRCCLSTNVACSCSTRIRLFDWRPFIHHFIRPRLKRSTFLH